MTWDVTVTDILAESYIQATSSTAGAVAAGEADRKRSFLPRAIQNNNNNNNIATLASELYRTMSSVSFVFVFSVLCYNNNNNNDK